MTAIETSRGHAGADKSQVAARLVDAARDAAEVLAADADEAVRLGRLTDRAIEVLDGARLLKLVAPKTRGGFELPVKVMNRVTAELAKGCASASWVASIYNGLLYMIAPFSDEAQDEVYSFDNPKGVAQFNAAGEAVAADGGYRLSGTWRFCSGQHHAQFAMLASTIVGEGVTLEPASFIVWRDQAEVIDDWQVSGLAGTGSNSLVVKDVFVPEHRVLRMSVPAGSGLLPKSLADNPYFRTPAVPFFSAGSAGTPIGIAEKAVELLHDRVRTRGITYTNYLRQAEAPATHLQMDEATMKLDQARFHADHGADLVLEVARDLSNVTNRVRCRADTAWVIKLCREVVQIVQQASGASAIHKRDPLGRMLNDIQALAVHSFLLFNTNAELHGRVLCGVDPDVPWV